MIMKKVLFLFVLLASVFWCKKEAPQPILIDGSNGVRPLVVELAEAFMHYSPEYKLVIGQGMGSRDRLEALKNDSIDIAMASHGLDMEALKAQGYTIVRFAQMPVVFAVNKAVGINNLSSRQICEVYSGVYKNWTELGGTDLPVQPLCRPYEEVDVEVVLEHLDCFAAVVLDSMVQMRETSGELAGALSVTPGGIGMTTMTRVNQSNGKFHAIALDSIEASVPNIRDKKYRLLRSSYLVIKGKPRPEIQAFLDFIDGRRGIDVLVNNDAIPVFEE